MIAPIIGVIADAKGRQPAVAATTDAAIPQGVEILELGSVGQYMVPMGGMIDDE